MSAQNESDCIPFFISLLTLEAAQTIRCSVVSLFNSCRNR